MSEDPSIIKIDGANAADPPDAHGFKEPQGNFFVIREMAPFS
jgi:hypothetical protein